LGADPEGLFAAIPGHEGAGIVADMGPGLTLLSKGEHVIQPDTADMQGRGLGRRKSVRSRARRRPAARLPPSLSWRLSEFLLPRNVIMRM